MFTRGGRFAVLLLFIAAPVARAQSAEPPAAPAPPGTAAPVAAAPPPNGSAPDGSEPKRAADGCVPSCRSGFVCVAGACVSACNPPCPAGQECVEGARCVAPETTPSKATIHQAIDEYIEKKQAEWRAKTVHRHDGLYLRFGFNAGYAWDSAERGDHNSTSRGAGGFIEYALGSNLSDHVVLGFAHHTFGVFSPRTSVDGAALTDDHTAFYQVLGLLLDYYPNPADGWHLTATLGAGIADVQIRDGENTESGFGFAVGGGYDAWIGEQWSLGAGIRLIYVSNAADDFGDHQVFIPTLALSALWH
jgi:hypothetical protein